MIALTQLAMRKKLIAQGESLEVRMWLFPYLTIFTILVILAIFGVVAAFPDQRSEL